MTTVRDIFERMPSTFIKDKAVGVSGVVQFDITGDGGGRWHADIVDGELTVVEGAAESPRLTLTIAAADYIAISEGTLSDQLAFMTGRIKAAGDLGFAIKMQTMFRR